MARRHLTPDEPQELRDLATQWGKIIARRAGHDDLELDLDAMEQIALAAAQALAEGTLQNHLQLRADALGDTHPCPACGRTCTVTTEPRTLHLPGGG